MPWVEDVVRYLPNERTGFFDACRRQLEAHGRRTVTLSGSWEQRFETAVAAIDAIINRDELPTYWRLASPLGEQTLAD